MIQFTNSEAHDKTEKGNREDHSQKFGICFLKILKIISVLSTKFSKVNSMCNAWIKNTTCPIIIWGKLI